MWVQPSFSGPETDPACGWHEPVAEQSCSEKEPSLSGHYKEAIIGMYQVVAATGLEHSCLAYSLGFVFRMVTSRLRAVCQMYLCSVELSARMLFLCAVQYGSHQPQVATEWLM